MRSIRPIKDRARRPKFADYVPADDRYASAVYRAEFHKYHPGGQPIATSDAEAFIERVATDPRVIERYGPATFELVPYLDHFPAMAAAAADPSVEGDHRIVVLPLAQTEWTILHEMAHCYDWQLRPDVGDHGPAYTAAMLLLVEVAYGPDAAAKLRERYLATRAAL